MLLAPVLNDDMTSSKRSVALVVPSVLVGGGVGTVARFLYRALLDSGRYCPEVISLAMASDDAASLRLRSPRTWRRGPTVTHGDWQGIPYRHVGAVASEFEFQRYRPRRVLDRLLAPFDLIQVVAGAPAWAHTVARSTQPLVVQVATLVATERKSALQRPSPALRAWRRMMTAATTFIEATALQRADAVFVENDWMYQRLCGTLGPGRVIFAPPGVDTALFHPGEHRGEYILSVGRFADPRKNVDLLLQAYRRLRQLEPGAPRLVLAGQGARAARVQGAIHRSSVAEWVESIPDVSISVLADLYRDAALFALSSDEEGLGMVILEAMASGLPVVSTRCGGPETAVTDGETGFLVPVGDAETLARRMQALLRSPALRAKFGVAGRHAAVRRFSIAVAGKLFLDRYDSLLGGSDR